MTDVRKIEEESAPCFKLSMSGLGTSPYGQFLPLPRLTPYADCDDPVTVGRERSGVGEG